MAIYVYMICKFIIASSSGLMVYLKFSICIIFILQHAVADLEEKKKDCN